MPPAEGSEPGDPAESHGTPANKRSGAATGGFRPLGQRERLDAGFFTVVTGTFVGPDGFTFERDVVRHPGAVGVVALEGDGQSVLMISQYRGAVDRLLLEIPAGKRDVAGEAPEVCAARELAEEAGVTASSLVEIARFYNSPGFCDEETIVYLAEGLSEVGRQAHGVEEEHLRVTRVFLVDVEELMGRGELVDAKSIVGLFAARSLLRARRRAEQATATDPLAPRQ